MAILGRLSTKDRLQSWGIQVDTSCVLCSGGIENHDHLFFGCSFTNISRMAIKNFCGLEHISSSLGSETEWGIHKKSDHSTRSSTYKLCLAANAYHLWRDEYLYLSTQKVGLQCYCYEYMERS